MSKIIFVVPPFFGHINPSLSIGKTLLERGHEVIWTGLTELNKELIPNGGTYYILKKSFQQYQKEIENIIHLQDKGANMPALEALKLGLQDTYIPLAKIMFDEFNQLVKSFEPDIIINDCITFVGGLVAHLNKIPLATITPITPNAIHDPGTAPKVSKWVHDSIKDLQYYVGIEEDEELVLSKKLNLFYTSQKFVGYKNDEIPPYMKFIGALTGRPDNTPFDWEKLNNEKRPIIYISLGTVLVDIRKEFFSKMVEALGDKNFTVVAATNPTILNHWPDNFIVQSYVPQLKLLKHVDVVIGHGGLNTVCDTYMNGIPMLVIPMAFDQSHTGALIEQYGCGIRLKYKRLRTIDIENAIEELLNNPKYKKSAKEIQESFIEAGGNDSAANLIENLIKN
ncbi:glycosyl transferase [Apibacter muscae]|uniref:Glycosyl transferase n=1 Tax=Apibacter muscae TaxID=2509004 RepID=A0A563DIG8_9FLAO|nr:nucleotide disphospho-sugar-binding domain-containing protein [Apibacter muscae]TWP24758.1 glycosyl transferase [Apibacter muscae]TWP29811.1 glycosyl transferase [Apibacter muscae]TWP30959.1 glycosyl transferase [Apibacter muscae]